MDSKSFSLTNRITKMKDNNRAYKINLNINFIEGKLINLTSSCFYIISRRFNVYFITTLYF